MNTFAHHRHNPDHPPLYRKAAERHRQAAEILEALAVAVDANDIDLAERLVSQVRGMDSEAGQAVADTPVAEPTAPQSPREEGEAAVEGETDTADDDTYAEAAAPDGDAAAADKAEGATAADEAAQRHERAKPSEIKAEPLHAKREQEAGPGSAAVKDALGAGQGTKPL